MRRQSERTSGGRGTVSGVALALYRKYRPRTFAEVIGQDHVTEPLIQALSSGRLNHAYLFSGPRGCGKTSSARILARSLNCEKGPTPTPCGECESCRCLAPDGPGSIDVIEIDAASHGGVDDARELRERAFFAPAISRYKIYIIDEAHMVSSAGFNALLKLVEEPPDYVKFVFATTEPEKVLGTIKSRTHHYPFRLIPPGVLRPYLEVLAQSEGVRVEPQVFPLVVRAGGGSARDALSVLDQLIAGSGPEGVTYSRAVALLGVTDVALIDEMIDALAAGDGGAAFAAIDRVAEAGHDSRRFAGDLLQRLRDLIILRRIPEAPERGLIDAPEDEVARMRVQSGRLFDATLSRCADILHEGLVEMRGATSPRLLLELLVARMLLPAADESTSAMLQRLERLESGAVNAGGGRASAAAADGVADRASSSRRGDSSAGGRPAAGGSSSRGGDSSTGRRPAAGGSQTAQGGDDPGEEDAREAPHGGWSGESEADWPSDSGSGGGRAAAREAATKAASRATNPVAASSVSTNPVAASSVATNPVAASSVATNPVPTSSVATNPVPTSSVATNPVPTSEVAARPVPAPSRSPEAAPAAPSAMDTGVDAASVRRAWDEIVRHVGQASKKAAAFAREAVVREIEGDTLVLLFKHKIHADGVTNDPAPLLAAVSQVIGGAWRVRCEVGGGDQRGSSASPPASAPPASSRGGSRSSASSKSAGARMSSAATSTTTVRKSTARAGAATDNGVSSPAAIEDWPVTARIGGAPAHDAEPPLTDEDVPYDPEFDGPPARSFEPMHEGFDPGDEPDLDTDSLAVKQTSEEQAIESLKQNFDLEKIAEKGS